MQQLGRPTYQQGLSAIGRYLDQHGYDSLLVCELADGYVVRASRGTRLPEAIPFPTGEILALMHADDGAAPKRRPAAGASDGESFIRRVVGSYRDFLAAFGRQCDQLEATTILVMELSDSVLVAFGRLQATYESWESSTHEYIYDEAGLRKLTQGTAFALRR